MSTADLLARLTALGPEKRRDLRHRLGSGGPIPIPRSEPLPASFFQERLWLLDQMLPGSTAYTQRFAFELAGDLDVHALTDALGDVTARHEALRTSLDRQDGQIVQVVHERVSLPLETVDLRAEPDPRSAAASWLESAANLPFDLARAPLWRVRLARVAVDTFLLSFYLNHTITDGWSNGLLVAELSTAYRARLAGRAPEFAHLPVQYADAAAWQRATFTDARQAEVLGYWTERLRGAPEQAALPIDHERGTRSGRAEVHGFDLGATAAGRLAAVMRRERVTAFMLVLSALSATLRHWTGQPDVVIGSSFSGRTHQDLEQLIGPMVSTVALRMTPHPAATGSELLRASRRAVLDAQAHADLPFERLVQHLRPRRSATSHPVFQVNLGVRSAPSGRLDLAGLTVTSADPRSTRPARFDLSVYVDTGVDAWPVAIEYNTGLFEAATVARLGEALRDALHGLAEHPERLLSGFSFADLPVGQEAVPEPLPRLAARTASCDEFERQVAFAFTQVLGGPELTAADDFFARGGHSMAGMLVVDRLRAMTGRRIDLPALFRHPTVAGLAAVLRETRPESSDPFVVPLATAGSRPPLILTPPALGQLAMYFPLVSALGADRPVLGVQPDGFYRTGDPGDMPLREQAAVYATEIASELPVTGPYHLCGFSAAGRLAVAIADELVRLEKRVGAVILLDSAPYGDLAPDPDLAGVIARWMSFAPPAEHLRALSPDAMIAATLKAGQAVGALPATMDQDAMTQWCRRLEFGARALAGHGPLHYPGVVTLLHRARRSDRRITAEWDAMPIGGLQPVPVIVESHEGFMAGPVLPEVARLIGELLAAADTA